MAIDTLTTGEGALIPDVYGEHVAAGHLFYNSQVGPPFTMAVALGEGTWDSVPKIWYRGGELTSDLFHFHPGSQAQSITDTVQGVDSWLPGGITYNKTAYIVARPDSAATEPLEAAQLIGRYRGRIVPDFDMQGNPIGVGYSSNPARILIGLLLEGAKLPASRIDFESWYNWKVYCDTPIEWNDGTSVRQIKRFEAHLAFTGPSSPVDVLNQLTDMSASLWQDDGELIRFYPIESRSSIGTITRDDVIAGSFEHAPIDIRNQPTRLRISFRDLDNDYLAPASFVAKDEDGIDERGVIDPPGAFSLGAMYYSQAHRLAKYWLNRARSSERFELAVSGEWLALLPGDLVTLDYPPAEVHSELCHVSAIEDEGGGVDIRHLSLAPWTAQYSDQDHEVVPKELEIAV